MISFISGYMNAYPDRFSFTDTDRRDCFEIISLMMKLVHRASDVKAPNLEEEAYQTDILFLKKALFLYADTIERDSFAEILETYIAFGGYEGKELLERLIIFEGMIGIYDSESPGLVEERMKAYLGEMLSAEYERNGSAERAENLNTSAIFKQAQPAGPDLSGFQRIKVEPRQSNSSMILSQSEIDILVKKMLG